MKTNVFFLFALLLLKSNIGIQAQSTPPAKKTPQAGSKAYNSANTANQGVIPNQNNLSKLPLTITKITSGDTLTISFEYGGSDEIKQMKVKNAKGEKETFSFNYVNSMIIYTHISPYGDETDTIYTSENLITRDNEYTYVYENKKLVEMKPISRLGSHYSIQYDDAGNAIEMIRILPPLTRDDEEVTQIVTYNYDVTLKNRFFFSTDMFICMITLSDEDDVYWLPTSSLYGLGSANLVKEVLNDSKIHTYQYKYLSFDESGYPTHYAIYQSLDNDSDLLSDYKITYVSK